MREIDRYRQQRPSGVLWPVRWSHAVALAKTRLPQVAGLIPILGYAVLWSDQFNGALLRFQALGGGYLNTEQRVHLLYLGSLLVLLGLLIYWARCPRELRTFSTPQSYAASISDSADVVAMEAAATALLRGIKLQTPVVESPSGKLFGLYSNAVLERGLIHIQNESDRTHLLMSPEREESSKVVYAAYFELLDRSRSISCVLCVLLFVVGLAVFLIPSLEVLVLALQRLPGVLASIFTRTTLPA